MEEVATFVPEYLGWGFGDLVREVGIWEAFKKVAQYLKGPVSSNHVVQESNLIQTFKSWAGPNFDCALPCIPVTWVIQEPPVLDDETFQDPTDKGLSRLDLAKPKKSKRRSRYGVWRAKRNA